MASLRSGFVMILDSFGGNKLLCVALLLMSVGLPAFAHEIPSDVTAHVYVKPTGQRMQMLVRVPLSAMRDIEFPEREQGFLDIAKLLPQLPDTARVWIAQFIAIYEGETRLPAPRIRATHISLPSDRSFVSFEDALRHVTGPQLDQDVMWDQVLFDVLFEYPIRSESSAFFMHSKLAQLAARTVTVLRFVQPDGIRVYEFTGDPGKIPLDPAWYQSAWQFVKLGFSHILDGVDHLLFLLCLAIGCRRLRELAAVVTAFTIAHSVTLIASAYELAPSAMWFPPLIEALIALSIVYMAIENIVRAGEAQGRWRIAFAFGLVHGFGFSFALRETLQFAGANLLVSLLSFNVGVELGQIFALGLAVPVLHLMWKFVIAERVGTIIVSGIVAHTGWHWMTERVELLRRFHLDWTSLTGGVVAYGLWWLVSLMALGTLVGWILRRWRKPTEPEAHDKLSPSLHIGTQ